jgi:hypothetical protein
MRNYRLHRYILWWTGKMLGMVFTRAALLNLGMLLSVQVWWWADIFTILCGVSEIVGIGHDNRQQLLSNGWDKVYPWQWIGTQQWRNCWKRSFICALCKAPAETDPFLLKRRKSHFEKCTFTGQNKILIMNLEEISARDDCAGEGQKQFHRWPTEVRVNRNLRVAS